MKFSLVAFALIVFNPHTISARYTGNRDLQGIPFIEDENEEVLPFGFDKERMMIKYVNKKGRKAVSTAASQVHLDIINLDLIVATVPVIAMKGLQNNPNIISIEPDHVRYEESLRGSSPSTTDNGSFYHKPNIKKKKTMEKDSTTTTTKRKLQGSQDPPYGIAMVEADQVTDLPGKKICIIDSGIDGDHPDLPQPGTNANGVTVTGQDETEDGSQTFNWSSDPCSHGTHVAGTIAALDNSQGVVGVTKNTDLHIVKVFGDNCAWFYASGLIAAIDECASVGSDIVSMSLGGGGPSAYERDEMQKHFDEGMLLIAAAGNGGNTALSYPASYDSVISVAAVDSTGDHVSFSQRNSQVEVAAPGRSVRSTVSSGGYANYDGTSMATPHVSGVAAIVWSQKPGATNSEVREALKQTATGGGNRINNSLGYGIVKAKQAVDYILGYTPSPTPAPTPCEGMTVQVDIRTDDYPQETAWEIMNDCDGTAAETSPTYTSQGTPYTVEYCLPEAEYTFTVTDTYGDGMCCGWGTGSVEVKVDGTSAMTAGAFGDSETFTFGSCASNPETDSPTGSPSKSPSVSPSSNPTDVPTESPTKEPTKAPSLSPSQSPSKEPSSSPSAAPTKEPSNSPSKSPTSAPTNTPETTTSSTGASTTSSATETTSGTTLPPETTTSSTEVSTTSSSTVTTTSSTSTIASTTSSTTTEPPACIIDEWYFISGRKSGYRVRDCSWIAKKPNKRCGKNGGFGECSGETLCTTSPRYDTVSCDRMRARDACPSICEGF